MPGLTLRRGLPPFVALPLGNGAAIRLRPATATEVDEAAVRGGEYVAALVLGGQAADTLKALTPQFDTGDLAALAADMQSAGADETLRASLGLKSKVSRLVEWLMLVDLTMKCQGGWTGIHDEETGREIAEPDVGSLALLLQDQVIRENVAQRIYSSVHAEFAEGNGFAASRNGAAAADGTTAKAAGQPAKPVQPAAQ